MKKKIFLGEGKLKAYSAMAIAFATGGAGLKAEVVYVDITDDTIGIDAYLDIDIDTNGTFDFHFHAGASVSGSWTFASAFGFRTDYSVGNASNQLIGSAGAYFNYASALAAGIEIGPTDNFLNYPSYSNSAVIASVYSGVTYGQFPGAGDKFLGFKFLVGTETHYGWLRLEAQVNPVQMILKDYAYELIAGHTIETGATVTIGINTLAEGSVQAYSFGSNIYLINNVGLQNADVSVLDLNGKLVFHGSLNNNSTIDMSHFSTGNYLVTISSSEGNMSRQLYIN